jgi:hypothetical protein
MVALTKICAVMDSVMMGKAAPRTPVRAIYVSTHLYRDVVSLILIAMMGKVAQPTHVRAASASIIQTFRPIQKIVESVA